MPTSESDKQRLRNYVDDFAEVLDQDRFMTRDLDAPRQTAQSTIGLLKSCGAIKSVDRKQAVGNKLIHVWAWKNHREYLQEYVEQRDELPCGCRSHVPPEQDGETYYCKFCGAGHSRETVKEAL
ncbi:MAG: hypothetical protein ABEI52_02190 [Halobacteriaceae archaeon]